MTPIFLHFGILHLGFDMYVLVILGTMIESRRGSWRFLLFVLLLAVGSNLAEYYLGWDIKRGLTFHANPLFGGMSGVVYGLFGYIWMKSRFDPDMGLYLTPSTIAWMLTWFFLCLFDVIGPIANMAHAGGLVIGMVVGYVPTLWTSRRGD